MLKKGVIDPGVSVEVLTDDWLQDCLDLNEADLEQVNVPDNGAPSYEIEVF